MNSSGTWWMWFGFVVFVTTVIFVDLFWLGRKNKHQPFTVREAFAWIIVWMSCALIFNGLLWIYFAKTISFVPFVNFASSNSSPSRTVMALIPLARGRE